MMFFLVGPILPPITGQSLAFTKLVESIEYSKKVIVNTNLENKVGIRKFFLYIKTLLTISINALFTNYSLVYFTCSRSFLGSIRDVVLINLVSLKGAKIVNHLHGSDFYSFLHNSPNWYQKILFKSYDKVDVSIVLLESMKTQFRDFKNMRLEVVQNFYDQKLDYRLAKKNTSKIKLLYLSNIMTSKGIFELLEAFEKLIINYNNVTLNIAGEYLEDEHMGINQIKKKFTEKIHNNHKVNYLGTVYGKDKVKLLQSSDIFILPSYKEAVPLSILEAMASGNAIVTTNHKYLSEVVSSKNGVIVDIKSVESLLNGITCLISDRKKLKHIQNFNKKEVSQKFSMKKYLKDLNNILKNCLDDFNK
jgi:glycosyltransferase involved in cell wall biosynthesis